MVVTTDLFFHIEVHPSEKKLRGRGLGWIHQNSSLGFYGNLD